MSLLGARRRTGRCPGLHHFAFYCRARLTTGPGHFKAFSLSRPVELDEGKHMRASHRTAGKGKLQCSAALVVAVFFCFSRPGWAAESKAASNAWLRAASAPATNALTTFRVKQGFRLELVAESPSVTSPVAMAFDENGRLFVAEMPENTDRRGTNTPSGRIRLLEDTEGTGEFHASAIYADKLPWASPFRVLLSGAPDDWAGPLQGVFPFPPG